MGLFQCLTSMSQQCLDYATNLFPYVSDVLARDDTVEMKALIENLKHKVEIDLCLDDYEHA